MRIKLLLLAGALTLACPAGAQVTGAADNAATRREQAIARREAAAQRRELLQAQRAARRAMPPAQRDAARADRRARRAAMPPEQQEYLRSMSTYRQALRAEAHTLQAQVAAGTLTADAMARQLAAFRDSQRPRRPAGMPPSRRGR
ncbi:MAG: hypothetical protein IT355_19405 [Gemmatimonadaceae bacterium]|nr:hypothetical protein [Gemmatimonadaceae bacterium]